jgi:hypothetical protein
VPLKGIVELWSLSSFSLLLLSLEVSGFDFATCSYYNMLPQAPKQQGQLLTDWDLRNCEPKCTFSHYMLSILGICSSNGWLADTVAFLRSESKDWGGVWMGIWGGSPRVPMPDRAHMDAAPPL